VKIPRGAAAVKAELKSIDGHWDFMGRPDSSVDA
jgi:hypothetical protein